MTAANLLFTAGGSIAAAVVFGLIAARAQKRHSTEAARRAGQAYAVWWSAAAAMAMTDGLRVLTGLASEPSAAIYIALVFVKILATAVAIWGLSYYVFYLWSGRPHWGWPLAGFAVLHALVFGALTAGRLPAHVETHAWSTRLVLEDAAAFDLGPLGPALFFLPPLVLAAAYLGLWRRLDRIQRRRVLGVTGSVFVFFLAAAVQFNPVISANDPWFMVFPAVTYFTAGLLGWVFVDDLRTRRPVGHAAGP